MKQKYSNTLAAAIIPVLLLPLTVIASDEDRAEQLCKAKIQEVYGISNFHHVSSEREGNHKFQVNGKVRVDDHKYNFNCKVKNDHIKSYAYNGPHKRHNDNDDSNIGAVVAVGAGLAILAALAASQDGDDDSGKSSSLSVSKSVLEDECHETLQYRIRDEHDYTARVNLKEARIDGYDLVGDAKVKYDRDDTQHASYTCHFDRQGRVRDSSYHLY